MIKQMTGAQVVAMAEDVPALSKPKPGGKPHPIDRVIHDGDTVTLGNTTLTAHLTPGHAWLHHLDAAGAREGNRSYEVAIIGSLGTNPGFKLVNNTEIPQSGRRVRTRLQGGALSLKVDVPLGSHPSM